METEGGARAAGRPEKAPRECGDRRFVPGAAPLALYFLGSFVLLLLFFSRQELLYDTDSYYHLAIARAYAEEGVLDDLRWTRLSALGDGFGDKEVLFHLLLAPLLWLLEPVVAGKVGLSLFDAALFTGIAWLGCRLLGAWGLLLPWWLVLSSTELAWRLVRLRPELLSLLLLLAALACMGLGRFRLLGVVAALYTLSYTAFHALAGLCALYFLLQLWVRRRFVPQLLLFPALGIGLALLLHPHFPKNLEIWVLQNFWFFVEKGGLDVGSEIRPNFTDVALLVNLGWWLGLAVLVRSTGPRRRPAATASSARHLADGFGLAAAVFGLLYLLMSRFSLYFLPLSTVWLLLEIEARGRRPSAWVRLPLRGRAPLAVAVPLCLLVSLPEARRQLRTYDLRTHAGPNLERLVDREAFARAVPPGARVAAPWGSTAIYMLWAPQGRYLNALDPLFMAARYPQAHAAWRRILDGVEADIPPVLVGGLDSEYVAFSAVEAHPRLLARVRGDPRLEVRYWGFNALLQVRPAPASFFRDWQVVTPGEGAATFPRLDGEPLAALDVYVDAGRRLPAPGCVRLAHAVEPGGLRFELAPYGPSRLWLGDRFLVATRGDLGAVLGEGVRLDVEVPAASELRVETCPAANGERGFFLRRVQE